MNKKGFTLVELLAVIAIIAIISVMIMPFVSLIRQQVLRNTLKSKLNVIYSAAKDYGSDYINDIPNIVSEEVLDESEVDKTKSNDCLIRYVDVLINEGYLMGDSDNKRSLMNPVNGGSLNNEQICIRFNSNNAEERKIIAYIIGEDELFK